MILNTITQGGGSGGGGSFDIIIKCEGDDYSSTLSDYTVIDGPVPNGTVFENIIEIMEKARHGEPVSGFLYRYSESYDDEDDVYSYGYDSLGLDSVFSSSFGEPDDEGPYGVSFRRETTSLVSSNYVTFTTQEVSFHGDNFDPSMIAVNYTRNYKQIRVS